MNSSEPTSSLWPQYVACYISLALMAGIGILLMQTMTLAISHVAFALGATRWALTAFNQFSILLLGLTWLVGIIAAEAYLRHGLQNGRLWPRIAKILAWEIGLLLGAVLAQMMPILRR